MKKTKFEKGITLIALIITIVVLLILAVVTIGAVQDSGIIGHAQNAASGYNDEKSKEESAISGYESLIDSKLPGGSNDPNTSVPATTIAEAQLDSMLTKTVNSEITDAYSNKIVVPSGFKILVDDTTGYTSNNIDVTKGIVVQDAEGNEFVWIPVGENITNGTKTKTIKLSRYTFDLTTGKATDVGDAVIAANATQELATSNYGNATAKNLTGFQSSAKINKGYYIARYEAGKENNTLVCKVNKTVYAGISQPTASSLSQDMYKDATTYTSDLINSYAWDTAIVFIQAFGTESDASKYSILNKSTSFKKTGANSDKYCNIYDMSGNAAEWSTETCISSIAGVLRSGFYNIPYGPAKNYTSNRMTASETNKDSNYSFRPLLYVI